MRKLILLTLSTLFVLSSCADKAAQEYLKTARLVHSSITSQLEASSKVLQQRGGKERSAKSKNELSTDHKLLQAEKKGIEEARARLGALEVPESCQSLNGEFGALLDYYEQFVIDKMAEVEREMAKMNQGKVGDIELNDVIERCQKLGTSLETLAKENGV